MSRWVLVLLVVLPAARAEEKPPQYTAKLQKAEDRCQIEETKDGAVFVITSDTGIGKAEVAALAGRWPERVVFRFVKMTNLEQFQISDPGLTLAALLRRGETKSTFLFDRDGKDTKDPDKAAFTIIVEQKKDGMEVVVSPSGPFREAGKWKITWINAYRR
jgi:hypothetical protein